MNYIKHTVAAHEHLRRQSDVRPQHIALYWALFFAWNTEYFDQDGLSMDHLALMQAARIGNQRTYRATLYDLDNWGLIAYQPSKARGTTTTTCKLTELLRAEVPVQNASTGTSAPTKKAFVRAEVPPLVRAEVPPQTGFVRAEVPEHSLLYQTSFQTIDTNAAVTAPEKKREQEKTTGEGLSSVEILDAEQPTPGAAPKEKVAPKRKGAGPQVEAIRAAATAKVNDTATRNGQRRQKRPESTFQESAIYPKDQFAAAFDGTDYALADLNHYHEAVNLWRDKTTGEPPRRADWVATAKRFMFNDATDNRLKLASNVQRHEPGTSENPGIPTTGYRSKRWD